MLLIVNMTGKQFLYDKNEQSYECLAAVPKRPFFLINVKNRNSGSENDRNVKLMSNRFIFLSSTYMPHFRRICNNCVKICTKTNMFHMERPRRNISWTLMVSFITKMLLRLPANELLTIFDNCSIN